MIKTTEDGLNVECNANENYYKLVCETIFKKIL